MPFLPGILRRVICAALSVLLLFPPQVLVRSVRAAVITGTFAVPGGATHWQAQRYSNARVTHYVGGLYERQGQRETKFIYLGDMRIGAVTNGERVYYHNDHLGSPNVVTDSAGVIKELTEYRPYGKAARNERFGTENEVAMRQFTGQELDEETGLYYFGARYYDPALGRFITPDTIVQDYSNPQTLNRYSYTSNNPINRNDPDGHKWSWGKFFGHLLNFVRVAVDVVTFPVNPVGSTLDIASVAASYTNGGDSAKISKILGWSALGWNVGQGIYNAFDLNEVQLINSKGDIVQDYSQTKRVLSTGINTTRKQAIKILEKANANLSIKFDAIIWNKSHGPVSDFIESGVIKYSGSKTLLSEYSDIINNIVSTNPTAVFDVHSEASILFTRAFSALPANSLSQSTINFFGTAVLESTARNAFAIPGGGLGILTFDSKYNDPITAIFGNLNPIRMGIGGSVGIVTAGAPHNLYGYLSRRYPRN